MKVTLIDTDILSYYLKGDLLVGKQVKHYLNHFSLLTISKITQYEILSGLEYKQAIRQIKQFEILLADFEILPLSGNTIRTAAIEYGKLKRKGITIGNSDILIAATALSNNMTLATNNVKHFKHIEDLQIINWKNDLLKP